MSSQHTLERTRQAVGSWMLRRRLNRFDRWVHQCLAQDDPAQVVSSLQILVEQLLRRPLSAQQRFAYLSLLLPHLERVGGQVLQSCEAGAVGSVTGVQPALLAGAGACIMVAEESGRGRRVDDRQECAAALFEALTLLWNLARGYYRCRAPVPGYLWRRIHACYHLAQRFGCALQPVQRRGCPGGGRQMTVEHLYRRAMLLALADPYQFSRQSLERLETVLEEWADHVALRLQARGSAGAAGVVRLAGEEPPRAFSHGRGRGGEWGSLCLDTGHLLRKVDLFRRYESATADSGLDAEALNRLLRSWTIGQNRRGGPRRSRGASMRLYAGLHQVHTRLALGQRSAPGKAYITYRNGMDAGGANYDIQPAVPLSQGGGGEAHPVQGRIMDESRQGAGLLIKGKTPVSVGVGQVVAVECTEGARIVLRLGLVRWQKVVGAYVLLGVEYLAYDAQAASVSGSGFSVVPVLWLAGGETDGSRCAVVAAEALAAGQQLTVVTPQSRQRVIVKAPVARAADCRVFACQSDPAPAACA